MSTDIQLIQRIIEGALMASAKPLTVVQLVELFDEDDRPEKNIVLAALDNIQTACQGRGFELKEVSSGFRFQVVQDVAPWVARLWEEKPQKYSRALLETLALIAYRQPITRGDIEDIRGVAVSSNIIKTLLEREWVRVIGHKDVPGRPAMYATTRRFLDYFNLKNLEDLPSLAEIRDLDSMNQELALEGADTVVPELTEEAADEENSAEAVAGENDADGDNITSVDAADHTLVSAAVLPSAASDVVAESLAADIDTNALSAEDTEDVNSGNTSSDTASNTTNPNDIPA